MNGTFQSQISALAIAQPSRVVENSYWRRCHAETLASVEQRLWMWKRADTTPEHRVFNLAMEPYVDDPFRGAVRRRWMLPGETILQYEVAASREALLRARVEASDIDLLLSTAFLPELPGTVGIGGSAFLARELRLTRATAWNLESACSSPLVAAQTADAFVRSGRFRNVLVVTSCNYSRTVDPSEPVAWGVGDAASAFVVTRSLDESVGFLGHGAVHTGDTCGSVTFQLEHEADGHLRHRLRPQRAASDLLRRTSERYLRQCCGDALDAAHVARADVDFLVCSTPLAWYADFCADALGFRRDQTISTYAEVANVGPVLLPMNLHEALRADRIRPGSTVLLYTIGSVSSAAASVVRLGEVAIGIADVDSGISMGRSEPIEPPHRGSDDAPMAGGRHHSTGSNGVGRSDSRIAPIRRAATALRRLVTGGA